jgi:hypothetical protein
MQWFLLLRTFAILRKIFLKKEYSVTNSLNLGEKESKKELKNIAPEIVTTTYNMKFQRALKIFLFSYYEYRQIWLNILMDDCHLSNCIKLKRKKKPLFTWMAII